VVSHKKMGSAGGTGVLHSLSGRGKNSGHLDQKQQISSYFTAVIARA
jgi:hypothetical protein